MKTLAFPVVMVTISTEHTRSRNMEATFKGNLKVWPMHLNGYYEPCPCTTIAGEWQGREVKFPQHVSVSLLRLS